MNEYKVTYAGRFLFIAALNMPDAIKKASIRFNIPEREAATARYQLIK